MVETSALQEELDDPWSDLQEELMPAPFQPHAVDHVGAFFCSKPIAAPLYRSQVVLCLDGVWAVFGPLLGPCLTMFGPLLDHCLTMFGPCLDLKRQIQNYKSWDSTCGGFPGRLGETAAHGPPPKKAHSTQHKKQIEQYAINLYAGVYIR